MLWTKSWSATSKKPQHLFAFLVGLLFLTIVTSIVPIQIQKTIGVEYFILINFTFKSCTSTVYIHHFDSIIQYFRYMLCDAKFDLHKWILVVTPSFILMGILHKLFQHSSGFQILHVLPQSTLELECGDLLGFTTLKTNMCSSTIALPLSNSALISFIQLWMLWSHSWWYFCCENHYTFSWRS